MPPSDLFAGAEDETRVAILRAAYRALCEHGYPDLTIQAIGDEFPKSKSLLYHHYDTKDELLLDLLEFVLDRFESESPHADDPEAHLRALIDGALGPAADEDRDEFTAAIVELRGVAAHEPAFREHFTRSDRIVCERLSDAVTTGVEEGAVRDADPEEVADFLVTLVGGAMVRRVTADDDEALARAHAEATRYLEECVLATGE